MDIYCPVSVALPQTRPVTDNDRPSCVQYYKLTLLHRDIDRLRTCCAVYFW